MNVAMDLSAYDRINPCGYAGLQTVDLSTIGIQISPAEVSDLWTQELLRLLG
jgi:lipoyl(octanoyl) transferase